MKINYVANGLGSQSMFLFDLALKGELPAKFSFTADTGAEDDQVAADGRRLSAQEFFDSEVAPRTRGTAIQAFFIRSEDKYGFALPDLWDASRAAHNLPLFGSRGGRNRQTCTDKWKIRAMQQQARKLGAKSARAAIGIHYGEAARRVKGDYLCSEHGFDIYQTTNGKRIIKWMTHYYPLVDLRINREDAQAECRRRAVPYIVSSQCDFCPHQDLARWERHTPEKLHQIAELEKSFSGEYFFTDRRKPLMIALEEMRAKTEARSEIEVGCESSVCFI